VRRSASMVVLLGSPRYMSSRNCLRELAAAQKVELPLIGVHEADPSKKGASLVTLRQAAPETHASYLWGAEIMPWHRVSHFQMVALAKVAERVVHASSAAPSAATLPSQRYNRHSSADGEEPSRPSNCAAVDDVVPLRVQGALAWAPLHFAASTSVYVSPHNPAAGPIAQRLLARWSDEMSVVEDSSAAAKEGARWLLCVSTQAFKGLQGARLLIELEAELRAGVVPLLVYEPAAGDFHAIFEATPLRLTILGIYGRLAVEWHEGVLRPASEALLAQALGARPSTWLRALLATRSTARDATRWLRTRGGALIERAEPIVRTHNGEVSAHVRETHGGASPEEDAARAQDQL